MKKRLFLNFGETVAGVMRERNLSQAAVAREMNVSQMQVSRWLCERSTPSVKMVCTFCDAFGLNPGKLFAYAAEDTKQPELFPVSVKKTRKAKDNDLIKEFMAFKDFQRLSRAS